MNITTTTSTVTSYSYTTQYYNFHVAMNGTVGFLNADPIADKVLGVLLLLSVVFAIPANCITTIFFAFKQKCAALVSLLYTSVCVINVFLCLSVIPVITNLFVERRPLLFNNLRFCELWHRLQSMLIAFSIFLVMMVSVTRTISIVSVYSYMSPKHYMFGITGCYAVFTLVFAVLETLFEEAWYVAEIGFCIGVQKNGTSASWTMLDNSILTLQVAIPSIVTFASFVISVWRLLKCKTKNSIAIRRRASVTIALFTAIFLVCNLPLFSNTSLLLFSQIMNYDYPEPLFTSQFMGTYSWILTRHFFPVLNTALNPILFYWRIPGLASWLRGEDVTPRGSSRRKGTLKRLLS